MLVEGVMRAVPSSRAFAAGVLIFAAAKGLKWWAILSLGPFWTFRVLVVPRTRLVAHGPYRWLSHPNYVAVVGELAGVALITGAPVSGLAGIAAFAWLLRRRISVESKALLEAR
jgi:methyltransferase